MVPVFHCIDMRNVKLLESHVETTMRFHRVPCKKLSICLLSLAFSYVKFLRTNAISYTWISVTFDINADSLESGFSPYSQENKKQIIEKIITLEPYHKPLIWTESPKMCRIFEEAKKFTVKEWQKFCHTIQYLILATVSLKIQQIHYV